MSTALSFRNSRLPQPLRWVAWAGLLVFGLARAEAAEPLFFIQLSDPQFGMYADNADFQQETANFEFAIATANRLKPAFVIVTGDLVNKAGDKAQADEYLRIAAKLDRSIPLYQLPGNHDIGNEPTPESIAAYVARFGPDHYSFRCGPDHGAGAQLRSHSVRQGRPETGRAAGGLVEGRIGESQAGRGASRDRLPAPPLVH